MANVVGIGHCIKIKNKIVDLVVIGESQDSCSLYHIVRANCMGNDLNVFNSIANPCLIEIIYSIWSLTSTIIKK